MEMDIFSPRTWGAEPQGHTQSPGQPRLCRATKVNQERVNLPQKVSVQQGYAEEDI